MQSKVFVDEKEVTDIYRIFWDENNKFYHDGFWYICYNILYRDIFV